MEDLFYQALIHGDSAVAWVGAALAVLVIKYVIAKIDNEKVRKYVGRAWVEVRGAVAEVWQTYVSALKEANTDGKLTDDEKAEAKRYALEAAKANIGKKGLARLMRVLGLGDTDELDNWLGNKVETAVDLSKKEGKAAANGGAPNPLP
jgi:hypothetical protein